MRVRPTTDLRSASETADTNAPSPEAPESQPSVFGPPWSTCAAKTGSSTEYGQPIRLSTANKVRIMRIGRNVRT